MAAAEDHATRANKVAQAEGEYREGLDANMRRLEARNPVGPRVEVPLITGARLTAEIQAGRPIWQARERAAQHREVQNVEARRGAGQQAGPLLDADPETGGETLDAVMGRRAREELQEFRQHLKQEAEKEWSQRKRQPDSEARKQRKRHQRQARKRNSRDDAERDRNHAIAHQGTRDATLPKGVPDKGKIRPRERGGRGHSRPEARYAPGLTLALLVLCTLWQGTEAGHMIQPAEPDGSSWRAAILILACCWAGRELCRVWQSLFRTQRRGRLTPAIVPTAGSGKRVKGIRKKVRFQIPKRGRRIHTEATIPFLGGPRTAAKNHPPEKPLRLAAVQGRHEYEQEGFALMLSRYASSTAQSYKAQCGWWQLFCHRRGENPVRFVPSYDRAEEQLVIDYMVHCATNEAKAPGTVKMRLAAIRSTHLTLGYPDPLAHMPRVPLAMAGLKRRFGTKVRRMPVTPEMLTWLGKRLMKSEERSLLWGALTLGFFFLLRASEYLDTGWQDPKRGLRGADITLKSKGKTLGISDIVLADEVTLLVRGSKTDIYNRGQVRNHFKTEEDVCVVKALIGLYQHFPQRYQGGSESAELLFRTRDDKPIPRSAIQALIERAAKGMNLPEGDLGTHSLRFGGASALWAQFQDASLVQRWGRWASSSFQTYIWEARESARGVARKMITADLTPS